MKTQNTTPKDDEVTKAARILAEDRQRKMQACMEEIQAVLDKHGFDLAVSNPSISLIPKPPGPQEASRPASEAFQSN